MEPLTHALVLAAGHGRRLQPLTHVRAKPAIPVGGVPLIRRILGWLVANGVRDVVVNLHHLPATLTSILGDGSDVGLRIRYSWEHPIVLGSAGGPRQALDVIGAERFFIVNGDTLTDLDSAPLAVAHERGGGLVTLALTSHPEPLRYGGVLLDTESCVTGFVPRGTAAPNCFHFIGVQVADASAFRDLPAGRPLDSIGGTYDALIARRPGAVNGFVCEAAFRDIGSVKDYLSASRAFGNNALRSASVRIHTTANVTRSIVWDDVEVEERAWVHDCIVTDGVRIGVGARHEHAILRRSPQGGIIAESLGD